MVDEFQKSYQALCIPYPLDNLTELIEKQREVVEVKKIDLLNFNCERLQQFLYIASQAEIQLFIKESNARICDYQELMAHLQNMIPFEQMTIEDFIEAFPNDGPDCHNRPTLWPHTIAEQLEMIPSLKHLLPERPIVATVVPNCIRSEDPPAQQRTDEFLWKLG